MEKPAASSLPLTLAIYSCRDVCAAAAASSSSLSCQFSQRKQFSKEAKAKKQQFIK